MVPQHHPAFDLIVGSVSFHIIIACLYKDIGLWWFVLLGFYVLLVGALWSGRSSRPLVALKGAR